MEGERERDWERKSEMRKSERMRNRIKTKFLIDHYHVFFVYTIFTDEQREEKNTFSAHCACATVRVFILL